MKISQLKRKSINDWELLNGEVGLKKPLILATGDRLVLEKNNVYNELMQLYPDADVVIGSTSGDITAKYVEDKSVTATAIEFEKSSYKVVTKNILESDLDSFAMGQSLINDLPKLDLKFVYIVSEGSYINGSQFTDGVSSVVPQGIIVFGGLCGDSDRFEKTLAGYNNDVREGQVVAVGFYGETFEISTSLYGGWSPFGPERIVTKSKDNILFELDGKPALDLYKKYLGEKSNDLPGAALLYPLKVISQNKNQSIVRTILNIDEKENTMILAGDIIEGSKVQLMMSNIDNIANASESAATQANEGRTNEAELAIVISCIGRKLLLDQRIEEEVEEVVDVIGDKTVVSGFYSYGEIAPFRGETTCQLHNQTITVTLISE